MTRLQYAKAVLRGLGMDPARHTAARRAIVAWAGAEDGWTARLDGKQGAAYNLLNTTLPVPGCTSHTPYNSVPVQNYLTAECGVKATVATLLEPRYAALVEALRKSPTSGTAILEAVARTDWGTFKHPDGTPNDAYIAAIYSTYLSNRDTYNAVPVGPAQ